LITGGFIEACPRCKTTSLEWREKAGQHNPNPKQATSETLEKVGEKTLQVQMIQKVLEQLGSMENQIKQMEDRSKQIEEQMTKMPEKV
jgi:predicted phage-related endonuclease